MNKDKLTNFEKAFSDNAGSSHGTCACGKTFYDSTGRCIEGEDWKRLTADPKAVGIGWGISWMTFEGSTYVMDCDCWHKRAEQAMKFLDAHGKKIAGYFRLEKERLMIIAQSAPTIEGGSW